MPISNFDGNTFVAYLDISGFKEMMKDDNKALNVLNHFYQTGYDVLKEQQQRSEQHSVDGIFVSDCGILFVREQTDTMSQLKKLLSVIKSINEKMLKHEVMLTTSIAYGYFSYQERTEFSGMEKNQVYGSTYVNAFLDNENGKPKIQPGQCRIILKEQLPLDVSVENDPFLQEKGKYLYYYWNVQDPEDIDEFEKLYNDSYNLKYSGMLQALKKFQPNQSR
jgi:hypothetical protein